MVKPLLQETFAPVTMGHIRSHGCRDLLVYCISGCCYHSATLDDDWLSDDIRVRAGLEGAGSVENNHHASKVRNRPHLGVSH
jgi:hypothetical protein